MLTPTIEMLNQIICTCETQGKRHKQDIVSDRLRQAATENTLLGCMNKLGNLLAIESGFVRHDVTARFVQFCGTENAASVLTWLREYATLAVMIATLKDPVEREATAKSIVVDTVSSGGEAYPRGVFDVGIRVRMLAPLAHGGDIKCGNATLFRRQQVLSNTGSVLTLPFYSGNAVRGLLRDALADHLLLSLGLIPRRDIPPVELWFFYALYSGGALEEGNKAMAAVGKAMGNNGAINTDGIRKLRDTLPSLSLLGCALGNRIISGRIKVGDLRPVCREWGNGGNVPVETLFDWLYLTRREDLESHTEHHGMIANTQVLRPGVELEGGVDFDGHASELERSALACGLELLRESGHIGADSRRGFGKNDMSFSRLPDKSLYENYLTENKESIMAYLLELKAVNSPDKSSGDTGLAAEMNAAIQDGLF